jgi:ABC-type uncharacterized transport system permease subunit
MLTLAARGGSRIQDGTVLLQLTAIAFQVLALFAALLAAVLRRPRLMTAASVLAVPAFAAQAAVCAAVVDGDLRLALSGPHGVLGLLSLLALLTHLIGAWGFRLHALGLLMLPAALGLGAAGVLIPAPASSGGEGAGHPLLILHVGASVLGVAAIIVTFAFSVLYLVQEHALKARRRLRFLPPLPSLAACERAQTVSLGCAFGLLSLGLAMAVLGSLFVPGGFPASAYPREALALLAWGAFALILYGRLARGWRGRRSAIASVAGFAAVMLRLIGGTLMS